MDEEALIKQACRGDLEAFNRLVLIYQDRLYNQAYRVLGDAASAADATQEAFIAAFRKLRTYRGGSLQAWLLRIVTNLCYDELRRRKRQPMTPLEPCNDEDQEIESPHWIADPAESPEAIFDRAELERAIQHCLNGLTPEFRTVIVLVDIQGMDYSEAALTMGCALGTIKSRLARARLQVRECLQRFQELLPQVFRLIDESVP